LLRPPGAQGDHGAVRFRQRRMACVAVRFFRGAADRDGPGDLRPHAGHGLNAQLCGDRASGENSAGFQRPTRTLVFDVHDSTRRCQALGGDVKRRGGRARPGRTRPRPAASTAKRTPCDRPSATYREDHARSSPACARSMFGTRAGRGGDGRPLTKRRRGRSWIAKAREKTNLRAFVEAPTTRLTERRDRQRGTAADRLDEESDRRYPRTPRRRVAAILAPYRATLPDNRRPAERLQAVTSR